MSPPNADQIDLLAEIAAECAARAGAVMRDWTQGLPDALRHVEPEQAASTARRRPIAGVLIHQTDVSGGFGPSRSVHRAAEIARMVPIDCTDVAIAARWREAPYHWICAPHRLVIGHMRPAARRTSHGGPWGNECVGVAYDDRVRDGDRVPSGAAWAWRATIAYAARSALLANGAAVCVIATHRQTSAQRAIDPGRELYAAAVPWLVARAGGVLVADREQRAAGGRAVPADWFVPTHREESE